MLGIKDFPLDLIFKAVCAVALIELTFLFVCNKGAREPRQKEYISGKGPGTS